MKYLIHTLFSALGAAALLVAFSPTIASAQYANSYRSSVHGHHYGSNHYRQAPRQYYTTRRVAPVCRVHISPRVITHRHYGGPIYYRNSSLYVRPTAHYYRSVLHTRRSYSRNVRRTYCR